MDVSRVVTGVVTYTVSMCARILPLLGILHVQKLHVDLDTTYRSQILTYTLVHRYEMTPVLGIPELVHLFCLCAVTSSYTWIMVTVT